MTPTKPTVKIYIQPTLNVDLLIGFFATSLALILVVAFIVSLFQFKGWAIGLAIAFVLRGFRLF